MEAINYVASLILAVGLLCGLVATAVAEKPAPSGPQDVVVTNDASTPVPVDVLSTPIVKKYWQQQFAVTIPQGESISDQDCKVFTGDPDSAPFLTLHNINGAINFGDQGVDNVDIQVYVSDFSNFWHFRLLSGERKIDAGQQIHYAQEMFEGSIPAGSTICVRVDTSTLRVDMSFPARQSSLIYVPSGGCLNEQKRTGNTKATSRT